MALLIMAPEGRGIEEVEEGKGGTNGDGRRLDLRW